MMEATDEQKLQRIREMGLPDSFLKLVQNDYDSLLAFAEFLASPAARGMTQTKADMRGELDALKRDAVEWYKNRFDRSDIIGMPSDREVLFDFIDHLAQRGLLLPPPPSKEG